MVVDSRARTKQDRGGGDADGDEPNLDPLLIALLKKNPSPDKGWPRLYAFDTGSQMRWRAVSDGHKFKTAHCCPGKDADVLENDLVAGVRAVTTSSGKPASRSAFSTRSMKSVWKQNIL